MGKSSKRKKNKKADFQKVKLKVGRKLAKGNVVDTTFKAKKIVVKEQLKQSDNCTKIELNDRALHDCLRRLGHYSDKIRLESLKSLKEILLVNPDLITTNVHQLIDKLSHLFTDRFSIVRKLTVTILSAVFSRVNEEKMVPFLPVLVTHLRCAATHLTHDVQQDALLVVDLLLQHFPHQVKYFSKSLLEDIVNQISNHAPSNSTFKNNLKGAGTSSKNTGGSLNVNLSYKITSVSWHLQLCFRLNKLLANICENLSSDKDLQQSSTPTFKWTKCESLFIPISSFDLSTEKSFKRDRITNYFENTEQIQSVISRIVPLLCEMWVEAGSFNDNIGNNCSNSQQTVMCSCIMEILRSIWKLAECWNHDEISDLKTWFVKQFGNNILQHCFKVFPFTGNGKFLPSKKLAKKELQQSSQGSVLMLNLMMCDVMFGFTQWVTTGEAKYVLERCVNYVNQVLDNYVNIKSTVKVATLLDVVKRYVNQKNDQHTIEILGRLLDLVTLLNTETPDFLCYISFMNTVLIESPLINLRQLNFGFWLSKLTRLLIKCTVIPSCLLNILKRVGPKADTTYFVSLESFFPQLIGTLPNMQIDCGDAELAKQTVVNMLFWMPQINKEIFTSIAELFSEQTIHSDLALYIIEVIANRYQQRDGQHNSREEFIVFINFLLTVSIGCTQKLLVSVNNSDENVETSSLSTHFVNYVPIIKEPVKCVVYQNALTEAALKAFLSLNGAFNLVVIARTFLEKFCSNCRVLTLRSVNSLCKIMSRLWPDTELPSTLVTKLSNTFVSYLELLARNADLSELLETLNDIMPISGSFSHSLCGHILVMSQGVLDSTTADVLGEMTRILAKYCQLSDVDVIHLALDNLKARYNEPEITPHWYSQGKYDLKLQLLRKIM